MRIEEHAVLGKLPRGRRVQIEFDGNKLDAIDGEPIASALLAHGIKIFRKTPKTNEPRGLFCAIGRCNDCVMTVNGEPNVRTCVTPVEEGMKIQFQLGHGRFPELEELTFSDTRNSKGRGLND
jgi:predicted molibdopterin-dependent oxidoreductase YjgC